MRLGPFSQALLTMQRQQRGHEAPAGAAGPAADPPPPQPLALNVAHPFADWGDERVGLVPPSNRHLIKNPTQLYAVAVAAMDAGATPSCAPAVYAQLPPELLTSVAEYERKKVRSLMADQGKRQPPCQPGIKPPLPCTLPMQVCPSAWVGIPCQASYLVAYDRKTFTLQGVHTCSPADAPLEEQWAPVRGACICSWPAASCFLLCLFDKRMVAAAAAAGGPERVLGPVERPHRGGPRKHERGRLSGQGAHADSIACAAAAAVACAGAVWLNMPLQTLLCPAQALEN